MWPRLSCPFSTGVPISLRSQVKIDRTLLIQCLAPPKSAYLLYSFVCKHFGFHTNFPVTFALREEDSPTDNSAPSLWQFKAFQFQSVLSIETKFPSSINMPYCSGSDVKRPRRPQSKKRNKLQNNCLGKNKLVEVRSASFFPACPPPLPVSPFVVEDPRSHSHGC